MHGPDHFDGTPELFAALTVHFNILSKRYSINLSIALPLINEDKKPLLSFYMIKGGRCAYSTFNGGDFSSIFALVSNLSLHACLIVSL